MDNSIKNNNVQPTSKNSEQSTQCKPSKPQPEANTAGFVEAKSETAKDSSGEGKKGHQQEGTSDLIHYSSPSGVKTSSAEHTEDASAGHSATISTDSSVPLPYFPSTRLSRRFRWKPPSDDFQWGIHWYKPALMISLALLGLLAALGHHLFNSGLHGRKVQDAEWPQRWGIALAFFIKMVLTGAVQCAYTQSAWV